MDLVESRPESYDPDKIYDEISQAWYGVDEYEQKSGNRFKKTIVVVGTSDEGNGKIYFGEL